MDIFWNNTIFTTEFCDNTMAKHDSMAPASKASLKHAGVRVGGVCE